jgi:predicted RNase H-like HicB family nuclease
MTHYVAIAVPTEVGEWRILFPDVPGCEARGYTVADAKYAALTKLRQRLECELPLPSHPRDLAAIASDHEWVSRNHVDFAQAVIAIVPLDDDESPSADRLRRSWTDCHDR